MYKLLRPDTWLNPEQPLVDGDQAVVNIVRVGKMDRIVQIGIDGQTIGKRQGIAQQCPAWPEAGDNIGNYNNDYHCSQPLHIANKNIGHFALRFEKEIGFEGQEGHREKCHQGDKFLQAKGKNSPFQPGNAGRVYFDFPLPGIYDLRHKGVYKK